MRYLDPVEGRPTYYSTVKIVAPGRKGDTGDWTDRPRTRAPRRRIMAVNVYSRGRYRRLADLSPSASNDSLT